MALETFFQIVTKIGTGSALNTSEKLLMTLVFFFFKYFTSKACLSYFCCQFNTCERVLTCISLVPAESFSRAFTSFPSSGKGADNWEHTGRVKARICLFAV